MHRYAPFLLSFLAGFLYSNPAYSQTSPPLVDAGPGQHLTASGTYTETGDFISVLSAHGPLTGPMANGGTITGTGDVTINVITLSVGNNRGVQADGLNTPVGSSVVSLTTGHTTINVIGRNSAINRAAHAQNGGTVNLQNVTINLEPGPSVAAANQGLAASEPGSKLSATATTINMGDTDTGAFSFHGSALSLGKSTVTLTGSNGFGIASQTSQYTSTVSRLRRRQPYSDALVRERRAEMAMVRLVRANLVGVTGLRAL